MWKALFLVAFVGQQALGRRIGIENIRQEVQGRISSGWDASPGQFPYQVALRAIDQQGRTLACGGVVIDEQWVLTAAHCTANYRSVNVLAGLIDVSAPEMSVVSNEWYNYPSYNPETPNSPQVNDISLIKLPVPLVFSSNLNKIQLQSSADAEKNYAGLQLYASGFGRVWTNGPLSDRLQWVYLSGISNEECYGVYSWIVSPTTLCARYYNDISQSICQGDTGGPLVQNNSDGEPVLVGIGSFVAADGCHVGLPAGFIRPGAFHAWFLEVTGINFDSEEAPAPTPAPESEESSSSSSSESSQESSEESSSSESSEESNEESSEENNVTEAPASEEDKVTEEASEENNVTEAPASEEDKVTEEASEENNVTEAPESEEDEVAPEEP